MRVSSTRANSSAATAAAVDVRLRATTFTAPTAGPRRRRTIAVAFFLRTVARLQASSPTPFRRLKPRRVDRSAAFALPLEPGVKTPDVTVRPPPASRLPAAFARLRAFGGLPGSAAFAGARPPFMPGASAAVRTVDVSAARAGAATTSTRSNAVRNAVPRRRIARRYPQRTAACPARAGADCGGSAHGRVPEDRARVEVRGRAREVVLLELEHRDALVADLLPARQRAGRRPLQRGRRVPADDVAELGADVAERVPVARPELARAVGTVERAGRGGVAGDRPRRRRARRARSRTGRTPARAGRR